MAVTKKSKELQAAIERNSSLWEQANSPGVAGLTRLLRLSLLRNFVHQIHTKRSEMMAAAENPDLTELTRCEEYLNQAFARLELDELSLENVIDLSLKGKVDPNFRLPKPVIKKSALESKPYLNLIFNPERLSRPDRYWELEIALEANQVRWNFEVLGATCEVHEVERFSRLLSERLWPDAVVLFVESGGLTAANTNKSDLIYWRGKWFLALNPAWNKSLYAPEFPNADFQWTSLENLSTRPTSQKDQKSASR